MKINIFKYLFLAVIFIGIGNVADAQKKKKASSKRTTPKKTKANIQSTTPTEDPVVAEAPKAIVAEEKKYPAGSICKRIGLFTFKPGGCR